MCSLSVDIKFCTCKDRLTPSFGTWTIKRYRNVDWMNLETGRYLVLNLDESDKENINIIINTLTNKHPFDFDYKAEEGDILNIYLNSGKQYEIEYSDKEWKNNEQLSDHLNKEIIIEKGNINN